MTRLNDIRPDPYRPPGYTPPLFDEEVDEPVDEPVDEELDDFWTERPELTTIHQWARARMVGPWAVLGAVLTRVVAATSHDLKLPATVGDEATLNLFVALVGPSGDGKGAAVAVSRKVIDVHTDGGIQFLEAGVGSGEGLGHLFARRNTKTREVERIEYAVLLRAEEVDTIAALRGRQGSTLLPELRKAWAGEPLGFSYADPTKRLPIGEHTYRLCLLVGVQPDRAALLFDQQEAGGGTPQRFLWMPTTDPGMTADPLPTPAGLLWTVPDMKGRTVLPIPEIATRTIREARAARGRGEGDALDGHALLTRLKVAAALTLLASRGEVTEDDWRLAGVVMRMSDRTRGRVQATLARQQEKTSTARALEEGHREVVKASVVEQDGVRRAGQAIMRKLTKAQGWVPASVVRKGLDVSVRKHFKAALDSLVEAGQVEVEAAAQGQTGTRLRLAERVRP